MTKPSANLFAQTIDTELNKAAGKVWHAHPKTHKKLTYKPMLNLAPIATSSFYGYAWAKPGVWFEWRRKRRLELWERQLKAQEALSLTYAHSCGNEGKTLAVINRKDYWVLQERYNLKSSKLYAVPPMQVKSRLHKAIFYRKGFMWVIVYTSPPNIYSAPTISMPSSLVTNPDADDTIDYW